MDYAYQKKKKKKKKKMEEQFSGLYVRIYANIFVALMTKIKNQDFFETGKNAGKFLQNILFFRSRKL